MKSFESFMSPIDPRTHGIDPFMPNMESRTNYFDIFKLWMQRCTRMMHACTPDLERRKENMDGRKEFVQSLHA